MTTDHNENQMGTQPIPKLLLKNSLPLMLSLFTCSLYNVVDSIFVSHLSEGALTALSLAAPVQSLMSALGCGIAVGLNAAISKAMGEKNQKKVREIASASMVLAILAWVFIVLACLIGMKPYFAWQASGNMQIYNDGISYLRICMLVSLGQMVQWVFDRFLIATGRSSLFLVTLSTASVVNLILDPILIFGYLGFPAMGTAGAAWATVIGQCCGAVAGIIVNLKWNPEIPILFTLRVKVRCMADILRVGVPTAIMQGIVACTGIIMNTILQAFSSTAIAIMGVCHRLQSLATIPVHGINNALIPIIAYNYGAKHRTRINQSIRCAMIGSFAIMGVVLLLLVCLPTQILQLFDASEHLLALGIPAIRLLAVSYFLSVFGLVCGTVFQSLGKGSFTLYLTLLRQVILPLGLALIFRRSGNLSMIWVAFILAEVFSAPFAALLMQRIRRRILLPLDEKDTADTLTASMTSHAESE